MNLNKTFLRQTYSYCVTKKGIIYRKKPKINSNIDGLVDVKQLAEIKYVNPGTIYDWIKKKRIECTKIDGRIYFDPNCKVLELEKVKKGLSYQVKTIKEKILLSIYNIGYFSKYSLMRKPETELTTINQLIDDCLIIEGKGGYILTHQGWKVVDNLLEQKNF